MKFKEFYIKKYKKLMIIPILMLIASFIVVFATYNSIGDIIEKDVSLKGGTVITINIKEGFEGLEDYLTSKFGQKFIVRKLTEFGTNEQTGVVVEGEVKADELEDALEERLGITLDSENSSIEETGSSLGKSLYSQMIMAILLALAFMAIVVFLTFRNLIPSLAVILSGVFDLVVTISILNLIGLRLSSAGLAALLLILGYSIDTDILLTTKVLKRKEGTIIERVFGSIKTGLTMTATTLVALTIGYFVSNSIVLKQMFLIIIIGLLVDVISTWILNTGILRMYLEKKNG